MTNLIRARLHCAPTGPEASAFLHDLSAVIEQKLIVAHGLPVLRNRARDVGGYVNLPLTVQDIQYFTVGGDDGTWSNFFASIGGLPWKHGTAKSERTRFVPCSIQRVISIFEKRAGRWWMSENIEGQHVNFRVPKHMAFVCGSRECTGADGHTAVIWIGCSDEVIASKAQCFLDRVVAFYFDVCVT